ncbi:DNA polymerase III subunit beta [Fodinicola feengrottensis]|uniref:DNA polymerase III subunit beta n=1 Tax=Fodinicola feengrottensis TaxID=435914 RepID=A0ABN2FR42_9ACTN|nr:DNA polymerase III subunit beta [Fodinicola feengrottensis]
MTMSAITIHANEIDSNRGGQGHAADVSVLLSVATDRATLVEALRVVSPAVANRPPVPLLSGVLLEGAPNGELTVSAFDYETSIRVRVPGAATSCGRLLVDHGELTRLLAAMTKGARKRDADAQPVTLSTNATGDATINLAGYRVPVTTYPHHEYPTAATAPRLVARVDRDLFANGLSRVLPAVGDDDTLPMLTGVRMQVRAGRATLAATDRYRLALATVPAITTPLDLPRRTQALVPGHVLSMLPTRLTGDHVRIGMDDRDGFPVGFTCGLVTIVTNVLIDADYPRIDTLFPDTATVTVVADRARLLADVQRAAAICVAKVDKTQQLRLTLATDTLTVFPMLDQHANSATGPAQPARIDGELQKPIAFRAAYLVDALRCFEGDTVVLHVTSPIKPILLTDEPNGIRASAAYRHLVMPLRLGG